MQNEETVVAQMSGMWIILRIIGLVQYEAGMGEIKNTHSRRTCRDEISWPPYVNQSSTSRLMLKKQHMQMKWLNQS